MSKLIAESYSQFLLEKNIDMTDMMLKAFKYAGFTAQLDKSIKPDVDNKTLNASIDFIINKDDKEDFISIGIVNGIVYWQDFSKNVKLGELADEKGLVKGIQKNFK
jgi:hypothetical protein